MPAARSANISQMPGASFDTCVLEWMQSTYQISFDFDTERAFSVFFATERFSGSLAPPCRAFLSHTPASVAITSHRCRGSSPRPAPPSPAQPSPAQRPFKSCSMHSSVAFPALAATGLSLCTLLHFRTSPIVRRATCAPSRPAPFAMSARGWGLRDWLLTEVQLARISCAGGMPIGRADAMDVDDARGALCRPPSHGWFAHGRAGLRQ